jgi:protein TonB
VGEVPGVGSGSGSGAGPGSEGGTGGGSGGGTGTGDGTGIGEGSGSGSGGGTGDGGSPGFVSRTADRKEPVVVFKGSLEYPPAAAAEGAEGTVRLEVAVTELGAVSDVKVVESSHDRRLDDAAVGFVRGWRYKPAVQDGQPRRVWTYAVVKFELQ